MRTRNFITGFVCQSELTSIDCDDRVEKWKNGRGVLNTFCICLWGFECGWGLDARAHLRATILRQINKKSVDSS